MSESFLSGEHIALWLSIVLPLGTPLVILLWKASQYALKVDLMWSWYTNHGSDLTGYKPGDERKR